MSSTLGVCRIPGAAWRTLSALPVTLGRLKQDPYCRIFGCSCHVVSLRRDSTPRGTDSERELIVTIRKIWERKEELGASGKGSRMWKISPRTGRRSTYIGMLVQAYCMYKYCSTVGGKCRVPLPQWPSGLLDVYLF